MSPHGKGLLTDRLGGQVPATGLALIRGFASMKFQMRHFNLSLTGVAACVLASSISSLSLASFTTNVVASSAPNFYGSPSWSGYRDNAMYALRNGLTSYGGDPTITPTAYSALGESVNVGANLVTGFPSWMGYANPTGAFASEMGNRIHFGMSMVASVGTQIALDHIVGNISIATVSGFDFSFNYVGNYSATRQGLLRGADGIIGTIDDTLITSGSASQLVDAVYVIGGGVAFWPDTIDELNAFMSTFGSDYGSLNLTGTYSLLDGVGEGSVLAGGSTTVTLVPAPGAIALIGLAGLVGGRRRRN